MMIIMILIYLIDNLNFVTTFWMDVGPIASNLLASCTGKGIKVYDKRSSRIVRVFDKIHSGKIIYYPIFFSRSVLFKIDRIIDAIKCVRWNRTGKKLATASNDGKVNLIDFGSGEILGTGTTQDDSKSFILD